MRRCGTLLLAAVVLVVGYSAGVNPVTFDVPANLTLTVSPLSSSETKSGDLSYTIDATSDVTLKVSIETGSWPADSMLTVDPPDSPAGGGTSNELNISGTTTSATLLENLTKTGQEYTDTLKFSADEVNWDQPAGGSYDLTLLYKLVS